MTATQIRDWGKALGPAGCVMLMWRYEAGMGRPDNQQAMRDVAATLAKAPQAGVHTVGAGRVPGVAGGRVLGTQEGGKR